MPFGNVINFDNKDFVITYIDNRDNVLQVNLLEDMYLNLFYENSKIDILFKSYMLDEYDIYIKTSNIFYNEYVFNGPPDINKILNMQQQLPYIFYSYKTICLYDKIDEQKLYDILDKQKNIFYVRLRLS